MIDQALAGDEEQQSLQKKVPKVKLTRIPNSKTQVVFLTCFTIFLLGYCVGEYFIHNYFFQPFQQYERQIRLLSEVRYRNRFVTVFAQEYMATKRFSGHLDRTMKLLYTNLEDLFSQLPDNRKVREDIYGKVE